MDTRTSPTALATRRWPGGAAALLTLALGLGLPPSTASAQSSPPGAAVAAEPAAKVVPLKDARLKIELNATDHDAGIQVFIDADPWRTIDIFDPHGKPMFSAVTVGRFGKQGSTELFMESGEPNFDDLSFEDFLKRFPEGDYRIRGIGLAGERFVGTAKLTHDVPEGPLLLSPAAGAIVDPHELTVRWQAVPPPNGSPIIGYQVLVVLPDTGVRSLPKVILDVMMPPTATSLQVPPGFLRPNAAYEWEVLALEAGGNQTLSSGLFTTAPD